jgi:hypothetical protein
LKAGFPFIITLLGFLFASCTLSAQMITGVWKGKINRQKVEVKIIQDGDSLRGTSYYYESPSHYRRYSIRGYFNTQSNEAVWWDDQLLEEKSGKINLTSPGRNPMLSSADFNCPGGGKMMLDGKAGKKEDNELKGEVHLDKTGGPLFQDEWDYVIENYLTGGNDPDLIDSISTVAIDRTPDIPVTRTEAPVIRESETITVPRKPVEPVTRPVPSQSIEEKFVARKKILVTEIPLTGDSIELRFYDNAEIDGDSISLFLNERLIFKHIRLTGSAYTIKLPVTELSETNELIMVAENLGSIPPNTSYMVAVVGENRYEARLESTEGSSAMIRMVKKTGMK